MELRCGNSPGWIERLLWSGMELRCGMDRGTSLGWNGVWEDRMDRGPPLDWNGIKVWEESRVDRGLLWTGMELRCGKSPGWIEGLLDWVWEESRVDRGTPPEL